MNFATAVACPKCRHMNVGQVFCYHCREKLPTPTLPQDPPNVVPGGFGKAVLTDLCNAIKDEVFKYEKRISLAEAIGILDIVKHELIEEHRK